MVDHTVLLAGSQPAGALLEPPNPNSIGGSKYNNNTPVPNSVPLVVGAGVDTLYQNYKIDLDTLLSWEPKFTAWKLEAQATKERVLRLDMPGGEYFLAAAGRRNYAYLLTRPGYGELLLTYTEQFRGARVRLYSDWIKGCATLSLIDISEPRRPY